MTAKKKAFPGPDDLEVLIHEDEIERKVAEMAARVEKDYRGKPLLVVGVLKGAWVFLADLVRRIPYPVEVDFLKVSSYGKATESSGEVRFEMDFSRAVEGKDVLLVEDIVDTGVTLHYLMKNLATRKPASVKLCVLLDKPARRKVEIPIAYRGFEIPDRFVVGYGLDCAEHFRNLPFIASLSEEQARAVCER
ncbi:MAG: hypoxanthine phosphoribosyltransferase [Planctomycetes bacterium]|jgi:hypoxanthine phosphoribosyltransferase|nr:hypoxanthine phosphoribosyltransferase [Planctomycetota bacterium]